MNILEQLPPDALEQVAQYFRLLSDSTRLRIMAALLSQDEMNVGEIAQSVKSSPANVSRHLAQMAQQGVVTRESRGNSAYYHVADPTVRELCDLVCGSIARRLQRNARAGAAFRVSGSN